MQDIFCPFQANSAASTVFISIFSNVNQPMTTALLQLARKTSNSDLGMVNIDTSTNVPKLATVTKVTPPMKTKIRK